MKRALLMLLAVSTVLATAPGCSARIRGRRGAVNVSVRAPRVEVRPPPTSGGYSVSVRTPVGSAGITTLDSYCNPGAAESCNGLDDNCDGVIDEGCGYSTGNIQITLAWATGADLDLYVTDPNGFVISYQNRQSPSGGHLDQDARGACARSQSSATVENVYWDSPQPQGGRYQVEVHYWGDCGAASTTQTTLSIAVGGQVIGAYNVVLNPGERQPVAVFDMP